MKAVILLLYFSGWFGNGLAYTIIGEITEFSEEDSFSNRNAINGTLYKKVKRYFCSVRKSNESELLVYDTKEWSFPTQDVSLNLDYPPRNNSNSIQYLLTEVLVIVHMEGSRSKAFITSGGMMRDHISMKFLFNDIRSLSYHFFLYGIPKLILNNTENFTTSYNIC